MPTFVPFLNVPSGPVICIGPVLKYGVSSVTKPRGPGIGEDESTILSRDTLDLSGAFCWLPGGRPESACVLVLLSSPNEGGPSHAKAPLETALVQGRLHAHRAAGGHRHHRRP